MITIRKNAGLKLVCIAGLQVLFPVSFYVI